MSYDSQANFLAFSPISSLCDLLRAMNFCIALARERASRLSHKKPLQEALAKFFIKCLHPLTLLVMIGLPIAIDSKRLTLTPSLKLGNTTQAEPLRCEIYKSIVSLI